MTISWQLRSLIDRYDTFFIDQFGTLHDGRQPYPGAVEALLAMRESGRTVVILSNSGKPAAYNAARFTRMGFPADSFTYFVTSGDVAVDALVSGTLGISLEPGSRCFTISSDSDQNFANRLSLTVVGSPEQADLVVISGSQADRLGLERYRNMLRPAAEAGTPAICTNPDIEMLTPDGLAPGAGSIALVYESLGGTVHWVGKPHAPMYEFAHRLCGSPAKDTIVAVGDSMDHDVAGAAGFGIDAVLVRRGVSQDLDDEVLLAKAKEAGWPVSLLIDRVG